MHDTCQLERRLVASARKYESQTFHGFVTNVDMPAYWLSDSIFSDPAVSWLSSSVGDSTIGADAVHVSQLVTDCIKRAYHRTATNWLQF